MADLRSEIWDLGSGATIVRDMSPKIVRDMLSRTRFPGHLARIVVPLALLFAVIAPCHARPSRLVIVVAGNTSIRDIADPRMRHLDMLLQHGAAGLMNVRTGRPNKLIEPVERPGMEAGCLTIGAGAMAAGGAEVRRASGARTLVSSVGIAGARGVTAGELQACRTGADTAQAAIVHTEIIKMQRINAAAAYRASPGLLGAALRAAGVRTAVLGNSSIPGEPHFEAAAIAMDQFGLIDRGDIDSPDLTQPDGNAAYGIRADLDALMREIDRALPWSSFLVIDFGDTYRADRYAEHCTDARALVIRRSAAAHLDELIKRISTRLNFDRDALILLSPSSRTWSEIEDERLTPVVIRGRGFRPGMLSSPSTRRAGVVTICDVAPTVLGFFGLAPPAAMVGRSAKSTPHPNAAEALIGLNLDASQQAQRQVTMRGASVVQSIVVVLATAALILGAAKLRTAAAWAALIPAVIPLAMLYLPALYRSGLVGTVVGLVALSALLLGGFALALRSPMRAFVWLCAALVVSLMFDLARGAPLISSAVASYSLVEGARYYGLGNELMGTLVGAAIIGAGAALAGREVSRKYAGLFAGAVFAVVFFFIGWPGLGADAGGAAAAAPAMAVTILVMRGWRPSIRGGVAIVLIAAIAIGGLVAIDALRGGASQSHIGRVAGLAASGGAMGVAQVAERKLALNFMLLSTSVWSRLLMLTLVGSALLYRQGRRLYGAGFLSRDGEGAALGCCVATVAAFAFNDSGVLAAAACSVFLWTHLLVRVAVPGTKQRPEGLIDPPARDLRPTE